MSMSMQEIRSRLSSIEGDEQMYIDLGPQEVPLLVDLLDDEEAWMAARAVYALARIETPEARAAVEAASERERDELRVAVAVSASLLPPESADRVLARLLGDREVGVRKFAVDSVTPANGEHVRRLVTQMGDADDLTLRARAQARTRDLAD